MLTEATTLTQDHKPFKRVLVANRGEIALRIIRTLNDMNIESVALYSDADQHSQHLRFADYAYRLPGHSAQDTYLNIPSILEAIHASKADAVHPGYGFLSENPDFAKQIEDHTPACFIGPTANTIAFLGNKLKAKAFMKAHHIPTVPGSDKPLCSFKDVSETAACLPYPLLLKASYGGGGRGMRIVQSPTELQTAYDSCAREAEAYFGNSQLLLEMYLPNPRHIEVQILCDHFGNGVHLFERDCSIQRRHQKLIEEAPSCYLNPIQREQLGKLSVNIAKKLDYRGVGTVEFIYKDPNTYFFMEMNTRIQVEHPATEMITGIDLIKEQIRCAANIPLSLKQDDITLQGHAIEVRLNAENPDQGFLPATGTVTQLHLAPRPFTRIDTHLYQGYSLPTFYDSLIAKVLAWGKNRTEAIERLLATLHEIQIEGVITNIAFQHRILSHKAFASGQFSTHFLEQKKTDLFSPESTATNTDHIIAGISTLIPLLENQIEAPQSPSRSLPWTQHTRHEQVKDAHGY